MPKKSNECRYCFLDDKYDLMISPCSCEGSLKYVHQSCLEIWTKSSKHPWICEYSGSKSCYVYCTYCEICKQKVQFKQEYKNSLFISLLRTLMSIVSNVKNMGYLLIHLMVVYYLYNRMLIVLYSSLKLFKNNFKSRQIFKLCSELPIVCTILVFFQGVVRFYQKMLEEKREKSLRFFQLSDGRSCDDRQKGDGNDGDNDGDGDDEKEENGEEVTLKTMNE